MTFEAFRHDFGCKLLRKGSLKNFDLSTMAELKSPLLEEVMLGTVVAVGCFSSYANTGQPLTDFPADESGIRYVEEYLRSRVMPQILKWRTNNELVIERVRTNSGLASGSKESIHFVDALLFGTGVLFGQCAAQLIGARWVTDEAGAFFLDHHGTCYNVVHKPRKFCRRGQEDGLLAFIAAMRHAESNLGWMDKAITSLKALGSDVSQYRTVQQWTDSTGSLQSIRFVKKDGSMFVLPIPQRDEEVVDFAAWASEHGVAVPPPQ